MAPRLQRGRCTRYERRIRWPSSAATGSTKIRRTLRHAGSDFVKCRRWRLRYAAGTLGARLRELRWKNRAWLATADTIAGWNGFEIRNAGSGRSPVRQRPGHAVMNTTRAWER